MIKKKLILIPSTRMDDNKKPDRDEHSLVRMSAKVRDNMGFDQDKVEVYQENGSPILLNIFKAFSEDIKKARDTGNFDEEQLSRIAFVSSKTFNMLTGKNNGIADNIWISNDINKVVFGADPEFLLFHNGEIINANNVLEFVGELGCDGAMAEVRPMPAQNPEQLVENIGSILKSQKYRNIINSYDLVAACYYKNNIRDYPVGGHIHIGNPVEVTEIDFPDREYMFKTINKIMDELIAIPMIKLDGDVGKIRRTDCQMSKTGGYGYFGEYRLAPQRPYKVRRLEHRTLSGMWMLHPSLAKAVLGSAKAVIDEVWRLLADQKFNVEYAYPNVYKDKHIWKEDFDGWKDMQLCKDMKCTASSEEMIKKLNSSVANEINKTFLDKWLKKMESMSTFKNYEKFIVSLYEILRCPIKELQGYDRVIQHNWLEDKKFIVDI